MAFSLYQGSTKDLPAPTWIEPKRSSTWPLNVPLNVAATIDHHRSILKEMLPAHLIIVAGHSPHEEPLLVLRIDDPEFLDFYFQRCCLIACFDYADERAGRSLDGAINFPLGRLLGHGC